MKTLRCSLFFVLLLFGCSNKKQETTALPADTPAAVKPPVKNALSERDAIMAIGRQILIYLKAHNYKELVKYFSSNGVRFSPYGFIDTKQAKILSREDFLAAIDRQWVLTWGAYDGTGDPIKLTVPAYLERFVYNADYINAEAVGYDEIIKEGNAKNNLKSIYPTQHFIDYHFSGFDQKNEGMDWTSLKLVIGKEDGDYYLMAIVHDQWTI